MLFREFLLQNDFQVQWLDQILPGCSCKRADIDVIGHFNPGFRVGSIAVQEKVEKIKDISKPWRRIQILFIAGWWFGTFFIFPEYMG